MLCRLVNKCIVEAAAVHFLSSLFRIEVSVDTNLHFTMKLFSYESALHLRRLSRDFVHFVTFYDIFHICSTYINNVTYHISFLLQFK